MHLHRLFDYQLRAFRTWVGYGPDGVAGVPENGVARWRPNSLRMNVLQKQPGLGSIAGEQHTLPAILAKVEMRFAWDVTVNDQALEHDRTALDANLPVRRPAQIDRRLAGQRWRLGQGFAVARAVIRCFQICILIDVHHGGRTAVDRPHGMDQLRRRTESMHLQSLSHIQSPCIATARYPLGKGTQCLQRRSHAKISQRTGYRSVVGNAFECGILHYAIVDEVDSILIDEARTPLIISGAAEDSSRLYKHINVLVPRMQRGSEEGGDGHFVIDEKLRQVELTEDGHLFIEQMLISEGLLPEGESLYHAINLGLLHHVHTALRAHHLFQRDVEYIVQNGQVVLIDEHTGRTMAGRRLSEGLHQAIEAKEGVRIQAESHTLASTTFQNYFRLYGKLAGMTGTADTEAFEFRQIYGLDVVVIPTNKPTLRKDLNDLVYLTKEEKFEAVVADIQSCTTKGAPVPVSYTHLTLPTNREV